MYRVIVTGASGFIGKWLIDELLKKDVVVYAVVRKEISSLSDREMSSNLHIICCDMEHISNLPDKIKERGFDAFYHLAWDSSTGSKRSDYQIQMNNVRYSCDVVNAAQNLECKRFLAAGTITERLVESLSTIVRPSKNMVYGIAKCCFSNMLKVMSSELKMECIWMQFSNVFGSGNESGNLIGYTMKELKENRIPLYASGMQSYDFIYVKDLVRAISLLGEENLTKHTYFIGSGSPRILRDYLEEIPRILNLDRKMGIGRREEDGWIYKAEWFDTSDLESDTGFKTNYSFREAIKETYFNTEQR